MLDGVAKPVALYHSEDELYGALTEAVNQLRFNETLFAVCTQKSWDAAPVIAYLHANRQAAARGALISRIFYDEGDQRTREHAQSQADSGIRVGVLSRRQMDDLMPLHKIPPDLGLAIFNGATVIMHSGLGESAYACRFECPELASLIRSQFEIVEKKVEPMASRTGNVVRLFSQRTP
jgi:hypothetical protein